MKGPDGQWIEEPIPAPGASPKVPFAPPTNEELRAQMEEAQADAERMRLALSVAQLKVSELESSGAQPQALAAPSPAVPPQSGGKKRLAAKGSVAARLHSASLAAFMDEDSAIDGGMAAIDDDTRATAAAAAVEEAAAALEAPVLAALSPKVS